MSADVGIGHEINIDIRSWIDIVFWSPDIANINVLWRCVPAGCDYAKYKFSRIENILWHDTHIWYLPK